MDLPNKVSFSQPKKRSVSIDGHQTSFTLEDCFWLALQNYATRHNCSIAYIIKQLDNLRIKDHKTPIGLSSFIRQYLFENVKN